MEPKAIGTSIIDHVDPDILMISERYEGNAPIVALLMQILRELRKEGPEERTASVKGFTGG